MTKKLFHAAMVVSGGESYKGELRRGLPQRIFGEVAPILPTYARNGMIPLLAAREGAPSLAWFDPQSQPRLERLMEASSGTVALAPTIKMALDALPKQEPALITVISDFQVTDAKDLIQLVDWMTCRHPLTFLKLIFATSGINNSNSLPHLLEERHTGAYNKVDAIYATHSGGQPGESIREHFGRKLDILATLLVSASR